MRKQAISSAFGILLIVAVASPTVLAGCVPLRLQPVVPTTDASASRGPGGVRPGDTNVTNLVAEGDVAVGGDLTVTGKCTGCGGGLSYDVYVATLTQVGTNAPVANVLASTGGLSVNWGRSSPGEYGGYLAPLINTEHLDDVLCFIGTSAVGNNPVVKCSFVSGGPYIMVHLTTVSPDEGYEDWDLENFPIEIRYYH
jgi:hypothetical protein